MKKMILGLGVASALLSSSAIAQDLTISITNQTHGTYFTPLLVSAYAGGNHLFQIGETATANLQAMAEGGDISGLAADMAAIDANSVENPAAGLLAPGTTTTFDLATDEGNDYLSLTAMLLPTNDGFVGINALHLPTTPGTYTYRLNAYDAGTEANNEVVNGAGAPGALGVPADPGGSNGSGASGVTTTEANPVVHIHRGVLGDTDATGGTSDLDSRVHRWLNPVANLVITVN
ncbi:MAG: spondin domain-containing protein [Candidatus Thiodiazotropha taylori]|nr:spondin domain-containing protein [Candidatus Thiodiazotropha taylori]